ncbi:hypothetical protein QKW35_08485 [Pontibacterium granulatum]|nr:hypothetical protein [Pontibacterium granulatum]MDI3324410.1 hypothetical protein [Pontibacterium granulatum]
MLIFTTLLALAAGYIVFQMSKPAQRELKPIRIRVEEKQQRRRR